MTSEYTPTEFEARETYAAGDVHMEGEFDRMIARVRAEARIAGLREAASIAKARQIDMEQCHKPDDCNVIARGAYLTCEDIICRAEDVERGVYD